MTAPLGRRSVVLEYLAGRYEAAAAGKTGGEQATRWVALGGLFSKAGCASGEAYDLARADLRRAGEAGAIEVDLRRGEWRRVRVAQACEAALYRLLGRPSPAERRAAWAALFTEAGEWFVPEMRRPAWRAFCRERAERVARGEGFEPFSRAKLSQARVQLNLAAQLLAWDRPCLLRSASAQLCHHSKRLGLWRGTLEKLLHAASGGAVSGFLDLGIEDNPSTVRLHGPLRLRRGGSWTEYAAHVGEYAIAEADLKNVETVETPAPRCVTVENPTTFHELVRLGCGDIFVCTSYPNEATVRFLRCLPDGIAFHHFGDTDPWGFDVLLSLREKTGLSIAPLHMRHRPHPGADSLGIRDRRKLGDLRRDERLADVREELDRLAASGSSGDFEQERLPVDLPEFPYTSGNSSPMKNAISLCSSGRRLG